MPSVKSTDDMSICTNRPYRHSIGSLSLDTSISNTAPAPLPVATSQSGGQLQSSFNYAQNINYTTTTYNNNYDNDNGSVNSDSISSCSRSPYPSFHEHSSAGRNSGATNNFRFTANSGGHPTASGAQTSQAHPDDGAFVDLQNFSKLALLQAQNSVNVPVPALRFDRTGALRWNVMNSFLYDFDSLQHSTLRTAFYLVDEVKLKAFLADMMKQQPQQSISGVAVDLNQGVFQLTLTYMQAATGFSSIEKVIACCCSLAYFLYLLSFVIY
jgi:hypothetical protein